MNDTTIRVSRQAYTALLKARGMLETIHLRRLSFDDALYISANLTHDVVDYLVQQATGPDLTVGAMDDGSLRFIAPSGSEQFPAKVLKHFPRLVEALYKAPVKKRNACHKLKR